MARTNNYRLLEGAKITDTIESLHHRIVDQFGERGLTRISGELLKVSRDAQRRIVSLRRPNFILRLVPFVVTGLIGYLTWLMTQSIDQRLAALDATLAADLKKLVDVLREIKADIALPIALAIPLPLVIAMFASIWTLESRWKRRRTLRYLHELRSIIHVIDMHQLSKDHRNVGSSSESEVLVGQRLILYMDHCAELLSLSGKVAALYAESSQDPVVIEAVSDLGQSTSNLGNKIWQKLNVVEGRIGLRAA